MLVKKSISNLSTFEIELWITRAELGDTVVGLRRSEALQFQQMAKSLGRRTSLAAEDQKTGTLQVVFVETPNETLRRIQKMGPLFS